MQEQRERGKQQLVRIIATSTVNILLDQLSRGLSPQALERDVNVVRQYLERFTPGDIAGNAAASAYCLEHDIIPEGHTKNELERLKEITISIYEKQIKGDL